MLEDKRNQFINPIVESKSIEVKPSAELVKKTMDFFEVDEIEATEYLIEERRKIKEKNELKKNLGYKQAA